MPGRSIGDTVLYAEKRQRRLVLVQQRQEGCAQARRLGDAAVLELAFRARKDPVQYRLAMLTKNARARAVLKRVAALSGWGATLAPRRSKVLALLFAWGTYMEQVVDLSLTTQVR